MTKTSLAAAGVLLSLLLSPGHLGWSQAAWPSTKEAFAPEAEFHEVPFPIKIVQEFLQLTDSQLAELVRLRKLTGQIVRERLPVLKELESQLKEELSCENPSTSKVGELVVAIHSIRKQVARGRAELIQAFALHLEPEQAQKFQLVQAAARLHKILPAFVAVGLVLPPPAD